MNTAVENEEFWIPVPIFTVINPRLRETAHTLKWISSQIADAQWRYHRTETFLYQQHLKTQFLDYVLNNRAPNANLFLTTQKAFTRPLPSSSNIEHFELSQLENVLDIIEITLKKAHRYIKEQRQDLDILSCIKYLFV